MCRETNRNGHIAIDPVENGFIIQITKPSKQRRLPMVAVARKINPNPDLEMSATDEEFGDDGYFDAYRRFPTETLTFIAKDHEELLKVLAEQKALLEKPEAKKAEKGSGIGA